MDKITKGVKGVSKMDFIRYWLIIQALVAEKEAEKGRKEVREQREKERMESVE